MDESYGLGAVIGVVGAVGMEISAAIRTGTAMLTEATASTIERQTIEDLLMPRGQRLGQSGTSGNIREITGNAEDAQAFFDKLTQGGGVIPDTTYTGVRVRLPNGGTASLRISSTASPNTAATIDLEGIPSNINIRKIKFNP